MNFKPLFRTLEHMFYRRKMFGSQKLLTMPNLDMGKTYISTKYSDMRSLLIIIYILKQKQTFF